MQIPIRNIWLLQLYASHLYNRAPSSLAASENNPEDLPDLVARILADEVSVRLHTGLSVGFRQTRRSVTRVRGRINVLTTERHQLLQRGRVNCTFEEIVTDTPANRLARAALEKAAVLVPAQPRYRSLALQLGAAGVTGPCPALSTVPAMRSQHLLERDRQMIAAAELLLTFAIPTTESGNNALPLHSMTDHELRRLFEHAVWGFYQRRLVAKGWTVKHGQTLKWNITSASPGMRSILPGMKLDITLTHPHPSGSGERRIVIDTKFTSLLKRGQFGQETLDSGYVYQMYAYLMSQDSSETGSKSEGLMLHPAVGVDIDEEAVIQGRRIRFATVDLSETATKISTGLLSAISAPSTSPAPPPGLMAAQ